MHTVAQSHAIVLTVVRWWCWWWWRWILTMTTPSPCHRQWCGHISLGQDVCWTWRWRWLPKALTHIHISPHRNIYQVDSCMTHMNLPFSSSTRSLMHRYPSSAGLVNQKSGNFIGVLCMSWTESIEIGIVICISRTVHILISYRWVAFWLSAKWMND